MATQAFIERTRKPSLPAATLPYLRSVPTSAVTLYTQDDCRRWFLPQGWEHVEPLLARGDYLSPNPEHHARIWARLCGDDAWRNPQRGAASAMGFLARCVGRAFA